ncbi:hypothetical protein C8F04DRAFT_677364 [Mycena alexandri]|uniref:Uncharacterized protein n=1 Tax=Mycena alexandri TaxID=1745969 RepID=A0AAD6X4D6_9AGAR|nr:hypothetical protein C8F04DRAFT_677364 [Mycena alexandri]
MAHSVLPPDRLPLELWQQIAAHAVNSPQDRGWVWLLPWLAVAPLSLARNMHGAAFSLIFRDVWWKFDGTNGVADRALVCRMLERDEEYHLAIRSLTLSTRRRVYGYETEIVPVLLEALARFPMLREFAWNDSLGPMPLSVLQTLLSSNRQLETLRIGTAPSAISPVDLSGFPNFVDLKVYYDSASIDVGIAQILCPHSLRSLEFDHDLYSVDRVAVALEALVDNALSLCVLRLGGSCMGWDLGSRESSYTFLHTVSLTLITPPPDTGLDFTHIPTLTSLTLDSIVEIHNFDSLPICIRTPHTLRHLDLRDVEPAVLGTSIIGGVHCAFLDSLTLWGVPLTQEDMNSIFAPQFSGGTISASPTPSPCVLKKLELRSPVDPTLFASTLRSSHPFPALLHLCFDIDNEDVLNSLPPFLSRANVLQQLELNAFRYVMNGIKAPSFLSPPSFRTAFKAAEHLRHISLPVHRLELRHPLFHELGEALQHISSLTLMLQEQWDPQPHLIENTLKAFSKFSQLQTLVIDKQQITLLHDADVEQLSANVPTLRTFTFGNKTWEIQRHAITGAFQRVVMEK